MIHSLFFHEFISKGELKESPWRLSEKLSVVKLFHSSGLVDTHVSYIHGQSYPLKPLEAVIKIDKGVSF